MTENIRVLAHSSIRIDNEKVIYCDPFRVEENFNDADIVLITHSHYDHLSPEDIARVVKDDTEIVAPVSAEADARKTVPPNGKLTLLRPYESGENGVKITAVPAYNVGKHFHPKENGWLGYIIEKDGVSVYIAGDTDINEDNKKIKCDIALVPVGGTYTMTAEEAAALVNTIKPKAAIPTHYGSIVGGKEDGEKFKAAVDKDIEVVLKL